MLSPVHIPSYSRPYSPQQAWVGYLRRARQIALAAIGFGTLGVACYFTAVRVDEFIRRSTFFTVETIEIGGASAELEADIRMALGRELESQQNNLALVSLGRAYDVLNEIPRVREAKVAKSYPNTLNVHIIEREPLAVVNAGELFWIDADGVLLGIAAAEEVVATHAPILTGLKGGPFRPGKELRQAGLLETLDTIAFLRDRDPRMSHRFVEWRLGAQQEISAILNEGVEVRFGDAHPLRRMATLASVIEAKGDLSPYSCFDLRFGSQVVYF